LPILQPLYENVQVETFQGQYQVQLEILPESTLTRDDIQKVLELASWRKDPNTEPVSYEGGRGILVPRKELITIQDQKLETLLISGTGYRKMLVDDSGNANVEEETFHPPSKNNFMDGLPKGLIGYSFAKGEEIVDEFDGYSPLGTYTTETLKEKIEQTRLVSGLGLTKLIVPPIEAYGRFVNEELQNDSGNFGFLVFSVPKIGKERYWTELANIVNNEKDWFRANEKVTSSIGRFIKNITEGLSELHQQGYVHLSTHLSNWYLGKKALLTDWETTKKLDGTETENAINRVIDLTRPVIQINEFIKEAFPFFSEENKKGIRKAVFYEAANHYCKDTSFNLDIVTASLTEGQIVNVKGFTEWMKECMKIE
jgi:hypothetical protein